MRRAIAVTLLALISGSPLWSQGVQGSSDARGTDSVASFIPGQGAGYGAEYFPANVLGFPDTTARAEAATTDPHQILALGLGGEIVLRFDRGAIVDRSGPDFTVFENAFRYTLGSRERVYAEPAEVSVSRDGVEFVSFPFDSLTLAGCAGVTPTNGAEDPGDPARSGGDAFDLAQLSIDSVRFVRLRDVTSIVRSNRNHPFWDATLNGFDLDAVVAVHRAGGAAAVAPLAASVVGTATLSPNPVVGPGVVRLMLNVPGVVRIGLTDAVGRMVARLHDGMCPAGRSGIPFDAAGLVPGAYVMTVDVEGLPRQALHVIVLR